MLTFCALVSQVFRIVFSRVWLELAFANHPSQEKLSRGQSSDAIQGRFDFRSRPAVQFQQTFQ